MKAGLRRGVHRADVTDLINYLEQRVTDASSEIHVGPQALQGPDGRSVALHTDVVHHDSVATAQRVAMRLRSFISHIRPKSAVELNKLLSALVEPRRGEAYVASDVISLRDFAERLKSYLAEHPGHKLVHLQESTINSVFHAANARGVTSFERMGALELTFALAAIFCLEPCSTRGYRTEEFLRVMFHAALALQHASDEATAATWGGAAADGSWVGDLLLRATGFATMFEILMAVSSVVAPAEKYAEIVAAVENTGAGEFAVELRRVQLPHEVMLRGLTCSQFTTWFQHRFHRALATLASATGALISETPTIVRALTTQGGQTKSDPRMIKSIEEVVVFGRMAPYSDAMYSFDKPLVVAIEYVFDAHDLMNLDSTGNLESESLGPALLQAFQVSRHHLAEKNVDRTAKQPPRRPYTATDIDSILSSNSATKSLIEKTMFVEVVCEAIGRSTVLADLPDLLADATEEEMRIEHLLPLRNALTTMRTLTQLQSVASSHNTRIHTLNTRHCIFHKYARAVGDAARRRDYDGTRGSGTVALLNGGGFDGDAVLRDAILYARDGDKPVVRTLAVYAGLCEYNSSSSPARMIRFTHYCVLLPMSKRVLLRFMLTNIVHSSSLFLSFTHHPFFTSHLRPCVVY